MKITIDNKNKHELKALGIISSIKENPVAEYKFHPSRRWRFDFAYPEDKIAFEIEGGTWVGGRHTHPIGYEKDCEKYNAAAKLGWKVYRLTPAMIKLEYITELLTITD